MTEYKNLIVRGGLNYHGNDCCIIQEENIVKGHRILRNRK